MKYERDMYTVISERRVGHHGLDLVLDFTEDILF